MCRGTLKSARRPWPALTLRGDDAAAKSRSERWDDAATGGGRSAHCHGMCCAGCLPDGEQAGARVRQMGDAPIVSLASLARPADPATSSSSACSIRQCTGSSAAIIFMGLIRPEAGAGHIITAVVSGARDLVGEHGDRELEDLTLKELCRSGLSPAAAGVRRCCTAWSTRRAARPSPPRRRPSRCVPSPRPNGRISGWRVIGRKQDYRHDRGRDFERHACGAHGR